MTRRWYTLWTVAITAWVLDVALRVAWPLWSTTVWQTVVIYLVLAVACFTTGYCVGERKRR